MASSVVGAAAAEILTRRGLPDGEGIYRGRSCYPAGVPGNTGFAVAMVCAVYGLQHADDLIADLKNALGG